MESLPFDVAVVGHFSIDSILLPNRPHAFMMMGGAVAYVSLVTRRLEGKVSIVSRVGNDFPQAYMWWLEQEGIDLSSITKRENEATTRFEIEYCDDLSTRTLKLKNKAPPIELDELPRDLRAKAVHIAPIAGEISFEVAERLRHCTDILSFDPQGLLRRFDEMGNVTCHPLIDNSLLDIIDIYKSSVDELCTLTGQPNLKAGMKAIHDHGVKTVIATMGAKGAAVSVEETVYNIPALESKKVVDPTGAGDAFIGGFLTEKVRAKDTLWSACIGSAAASLVVEGLGPTCLGDKEEIYRRAEAIYEK